jgi:hypothetical protein
MGLIIIWSSFILFIGFSQELTQLQYFLYSGFIFCLVYLHNLVNYTNMSSRIIVITSSIPIIIFWYVAFVYNDFLSLTSIKYEMFVGVLFVYLYLIIYVSCEPKPRHHNLYQKKDEF